MKKYKKVKGEPIAYYDTKNERVLKYDGHGYFCYESWVELDNISEEEIESDQFIPIYPNKNIPNELTLKLKDEHINVLMNALEAYSRAKTGQFDMMLEAIFPEKAWEMSRDERDALSVILRKYFIDDDLTQKNKNASLGIYNEKTGDGKMAWTIKKILDEYRSVKNNHGFWGTHVGFDGPLENDGPTTNFDGSIYYTVHDSDLNLKLWEYYQKKDYKPMWKIFGEQFPWVHRGSAEIVALPKSPNNINDRLSVKFALQVKKPSIELEDNSYEK
jgi:hypothetical protein